MYQKCHWILRRSQQVIQPGDIITEINGQAIVNLKDIVATLLKCSSGQTVDVRYKRADASGYQDLQASVTLKVLQ